MITKTKALMLSSLLVIFILVLLLTINIHPYLSAASPVDGKILIFESWIYNIDNSVQEAVKEFNNRSYKAILIVGFTNGTDALNTEKDCMVTRAQEAFVDKGVSAQSLFPVFVPRVQRHKTFSLALGSRIWIEQNNFDENSINVFTFGPHARKSEVVFKQVFEPKYNVGVLSATPVHYNPKYWWCSWMGIKWVFFDFIKYLRAYL